MAARSWSEEGKKEQLLMDQGHSFQSDENVRVKWWWLELDVDVLENTKFSILKR